MDKQREKLIGVLAYAASDAYSIATKKDVEELSDFILADEEIKHAFELLKAEKEGRLLETPCKEGDTVFCIWQYSDFTSEEDPFIEEATAVSFVLDGSVKVIPSGYSDKVNSWYRLIDICFSREDAEKALKNVPDTNVGNKIGVE